MELVAISRTGDQEAFGQLWSRHYQAALRTARTLTNKHDPEDLVQEAFAKIFLALQNGNGPRDVFRAYLYTVLRSVSMQLDTGTASAASYDEMPDSLELSYTFEEPLLENSIASRAFAALKTEHKAVLWYLEVEGMAPREVAPIVGMSANAVSALAVRAREALRKSWLRAHINTTSASAECQWTVTRLADYNRNSLPPRAKGKVETHVAGCIDCSLLVSEVDQLSKNLGIALLPLFLGPASLGVLDSSSAGSLGGLDSLGSKHRFSLSGKLAVCAGGVVVAGAIAAALMLGGLPAGPSSQAGSQLAESAEIVPTAAATDPVVPESTQPKDPANPSNPTVLVEPSSENSARAVGQDVPLDNSDQNQPESQPTTTADAPTPAVGPVAVDVQPLQPAPVQPVPVQLAPVQPVPAQPAPVAPIEPTPTRPTEPVPMEPTQPTEPAPLLSPVISAVTASAEGLVVPMLSGTAEPMSTVTVIDTASGEPVSTALADSAGNWEAVPELMVAASATSQLSYSFSAYQTLGEQVSELSAPSAPVTMAVPDQITVAPAAAPGRFVISFSGITGATIEVLIDGVSTGNLHQLTGREVKRTLPDVSPGTHQVTLRYIGTESPDNTAQHGVNVLVDWFIE